MNILHSRIDALVAIAEAAEDLCRVVGERAADGDFNPLPQASLTGVVREEIAPHVFRQWAATKAALYRAEIGMVDMGEVLARSGCDQERGRAIPICERCAHKATDHDIDDEERRECLAFSCACEQFEVTP